MTIKESEEYCKKYTQNNLRPSANILYSKNEEDAVKNLFCLIHYLVLNPKISRLQQKILMRKISVNPLVSEIKHKNDVFYMDTKYGSGYFYQSKILFNDNKKPFFIMSNSCYSNTFLNCYFLSYFQNSAEMLTGITNIPTEKTGNLHSVTLMKKIENSVLLTENTIVDFNNNLAMSEDLYKFIYSFEVLNKVDAKQIQEDYPVLDKVSKSCKFSFATYGLANEELTKKCKDVAEGKEPPFKLTTWDIPISNKDKEKE